MATALSGPPRQSLRYTPLSQERAVAQRDSRATRLRRRSGTTLAQKKRAPLRKEALLAIVCPADAVLAKLPFPSKQGWITVGALLTSNQGLSLNRAQPSLHGIIISGLGHWPGIPNTAGQNICTFRGKVPKIERTIRVVSLRDARQATLLVVGARRSLRLG